MSLRFSSLFLSGAICAAGVLAVGAFAGWLAFWGRSNDPAPQPQPAEAKVFRECATEAGISWRMNFLNNEQGENFRINLYDHGSGLAVGDFDGNGREGIYFCNQLG